MKKIFLSLCIAVLLFNIVSPVVMAANAEYDHEKLMEYDGYGKAMYETIVEETSFVTGQYTKNKDYVNKSIDQIRDYANFWWNDQKWDSEPWTYDRFKEMVAKPTGYLLTVGDWVKKLFGGYKEKHHPSEPVPDYYNQFVEFYSNDSEMFRVKPGYTMRIDNGLTYTAEKGFKKVEASIDWISNSVIDVSFVYGGVRFGTKRFYYEEDKNFFKTWKANGNFQNVMHLAALTNTRIDFLENGQEIIRPSLPNDFDDFKKYIDDKFSQITTPRPTPYLSCPNGTKIQMSIDGGTFLGVDGKAMIVNKDGTAKVDSSICKLGWNKPVVKYIDNRAAIETPDGKWQDAETGKMLDGDGGDGEGECGMLCSLGKLAEFVLNFFEKLLEFFIKIFIPEDMDFISNEFDKLKNTFDDKLGIVGVLSGSIKNLFSQENPNPLQNLTISLPATGGEPIKVMEMSFIEQHVPTLKKVMSGILVLITVFYVYRKITGRGGVMEK